MNLVLLGAPGAGKGTLAAILIDKMGVPSISTGNILREAIKNGTELGKKAKAFMDEGKLVPDDVVIGMLEARIAQPDCAKGYILDGFPRTIPQAEALDRIAKIDCALSLEVPDEVIAQRMSGRRVCLKCGATYHVSMLGDQTNCAQCGEKLIQRDDDKAETVLSRLTVYHKQTAPLVSFYENKGLLHRINGAQDMDTIFASIMETLGVKQ